MYFQTHGKSFPKGDYSELRRLKKRMKAEYEKIIKEMIEKGEYSFDPPTGDNLVCQAYAI